MEIKLGIHIMYVPQVMSKTTSKIRPYCYIGIVFAGFWKKSLPCAIYKMPPDSEFDHNNLDK